VDLIQFLNGWLTYAASKLEYLNAFEKCVDFTSLNTMKGAAKVTRPLNKLAYV